MSSAPAVFSKKKKCARERERACCQRWHVALRRLRERSVERFSPARRRGCARGLTACNTDPMCQTLPASVPCLRPAARTSATTVRRRRRKKQPSGSCKTPVKIPAESDPPAMRSAPSRPADGSAPAGLLQPTAAAEQNATTSNSAIICSIFSAPRRHDPREGGARIDEWIDRI